MTGVAHLRALAEKATQGPWHDYIDPMSGMLYLTDDAGNTIAMTSPMEDDPEAEGANAAFIAACGPQTILALLDENERLREALERSIPDDIRVTAQDVADRSACASWAEVAEQVTAALMAERERCAKIAGTAYNEDEGQRIAAAIKLARGRRQYAP